MKFLLKNVAHRGTNCIVPAGRGMPSEGQEVLQMKPLFFLSDVSVFADFGILKSNLPKKTTSTYLRNQNMKGTIRNKPLL